MGSRYQREVVSRPFLGTINVIFVTPSRVGSRSSKVMSIATRLDHEKQIPKSKRVKIETQPTLGFSDEDMIRTYQPYDDALVVALHIEGYDVKRALVDQEAGLKLCIQICTKG